MPPNAPIKSTSGVPLLPGEVGTIVENMLNGMAYCKMLFEDGQPSDFIYLYTNPAFESLTGLSGVIGKRVTDAIPGIRETDPLSFEIYGRVARGANRRNSKPMSRHSAPGSRSRFTVPSPNTSWPCLTSSPSISWRSGISFWPTNGCRWLNALRVRGYGTGISPRGHSPGQTNSFACSDWILLPPSPLSIRGEAWCIRMICKGPKR